MRESPNDRRGPGAGCSSNTTMTDHVPSPRWHLATGVFTGFWDSAVSKIRELLILHYH